MSRIADDLQPAETSSQQPSLPANRAFVLQFAAPPGRGRSCCGRIEHVTSGKTVLFGSWKQLRDFVDRILSEVAGESR
jgi:hypothetical protein